MQEVVGVSRMTAIQANEVSICLRIGCETTEREAMLLETYKYVPIAQCVYCEQNDHVVYSQHPYLID